MPSAAHVSAASALVTQLIGNAPFERRVLGEHGVEIGAVIDTLTMSRSLRGRGADGGHSLAAVADRELGLVIDKSEQTSIWSRRPLTPEQIAYAATDAEILTDLHRTLTAASAQTVSCDRQWVIPPVCHACVVPASSCHVPVQQ